MHHLFGFHLIGIGKAFRQKTKQKVDDAGTQHTNKHASQQVARIVNAQIQPRITRQQGPENQKQAEVTPSQEKNHKAGESPTIGGMGRRKAESSTTVSVHNMDKR